MLLSSFYIAAGLILLALGAEGLVRGATGLAFRMGVTALAIGLTVVAFGTSSPELVLCVEAAMEGSSGIALGNVIGSNISNIFLILGLAALVRPMTVRSELIRREMPLMIAATLMLSAMLIDGKLDRTEGLVLVTGAVGYTVFSYISARRGESRGVTAEFDEALAPPRRHAWSDAAMLAGGLGSLLAGAHLLLEGAVAVAARFGISQVVIGLSVIAVGTSLPELATAVACSLRGEADVAFGNVIGSNVLNILAVLGVAVLVRPFEVQGLTGLDLAVFITGALLLMAMMWRGYVLTRLEGALLLSGYAAYIYSLVP